VARAFKIAAVARPAVCAFAVAGISWLLHAVVARLLASNTHPANVVVAGSTFGALDAGRPVDASVFVAGPTVVAVRFTRAVHLVASNLSPAWVAGTLCKSRVALTMPGAVFAVFAWTSSNLADVTTEALFVVTFARAIVLSFSVAGALDIATFASPTLRALADARVHWLLLTVGARFVARFAHPPRLAVFASWRVELVVTVTSVDAVRLTWAIRSLAARTLPACFAVARGVGSVALAVAGARFAILHSVKPAQTTDVWSWVLAWQAIGSVSAISVLEASAVTWTAWITAEGAPEALSVVTDADCLAGGGVDLTMARAFRVATFAGPPGLTLAVARVHWVLLAVDTWLLTCCAHPIFVALDARWGVQLLVAGAAIVARWVAWAVCIVAAFALPAWVAIAHSGCLVALAIT